jgi:hypothetical protein
MIILFGTAFLGKVDKIEKQWVETSFFYLFVPLFPVSSMLVTSSEFRRRQGMKIALNTRSVIAAYARIYLFLLSAYMIWMNWFIASNRFGSFAIRYDFFFFLTIAVVAGWVYFMFFFGRPKEIDVKVRKKIATCTGLYALPEWFDNNEADRFLTSYLNSYRQTYPDADWKKDLESAHLPEEKHQHLYAIALFNCMTFGSDEDAELYYKADRIYMEGKSTLPQMQSLL